MRYLGFLQEVVSILCVWKRLHCCDQKDCGGLCFLKTVIATSLTPLEKTDTHWEMKSISPPWTWKWLYNCSKITLEHRVKLLLQNNLTKALWFPLGHQFLSWDICIWNPIIIALKKPELSGVETPDDKVRVQSRYQPGDTWGNEIYNPSPLLSHHLAEATDMSDRQAIPAVPCLN